MARKSGAEAFWSQWIVWVPVLLFVLAVITFYFLNIGSTFESQDLLITLSVLFSSSVSFFIMYLAARSYLTTGSRAVLLLGCGAMLFAFINVMGGIMMNSPNPATTIYNTGAFLAGLCYVVSAFLAYNQRPHLKVPTGTLSHLGFTYASILIVICLLILGTVAGLTPAFFVEGQGSTLLRQVILNVTVIEFVVASICLYLLYRSSRTPFLRLYSLGLLLIGMGIWTLSLSNSIWTPLTWVARGGQYLGVLYLLIGVWSISESGGDWRIPLERALRETEDKYRTIVETANEGILMLDADTRISYINKKFADMLGYNVEELLGTSMYKYLEDPDAGRNRFEMRQQGIKGSADTKLIHKDGSLIWIFTNVTPMFDKDGRFVGTVSMITDITERKRVEEALRASEEKYRGIVETANEGIWIADVNSRTTFVNKRMADMLGYAPEEVIGKSFNDFLDKAGQDLGIQMIQRRQDGIQDSYERKFMRKDGSILWTITNASPIMGRDGKLIGTMGMLTDITKRKRVEDALLESEEKYRNIVETAGEGIWVLDNNATTVSVNTRMADMLGYSVEELVGKNAYDFVYEEDRELGRQIAAKAIRDVKEQVEFRYRKKDGSPLWTIMSSKQLFDDNGKHQGSFAMFTDITERKRTEDALAEAKNRLTADLTGMSKLQNISTHLVIQDNLRSLFGETVEAAIEITYADKGNIQMLDENGVLKIVESRGFRQPWLDYFNSVHESTAAVCGTAMARGERVIVEDVTKSPIFIGTPALEVQLMEGVRAVQSTPLFSRSGRLLGMFSTHYRVPHRPEESELFLLDMLARQAADLIERIQAEEELKIAKMQAELYLDLMGHDISNMHQIAIGQLELAQEVIKTDGMLEAADGGELIDTSLDSLERSAKLIDNVRKLQKIRSNKDVMDKEVSIDNVLADVIKQYDGQYPEKTVKIEMKEGPHIVNANELLRDVFTNLIGNAIKHSNGSKVEISVKLEDVLDNGKTYYKISIEDDGPGIPDDMKERIFNRLQRGETQAKGMGLGLYLVNSLVDSYNGSVWAEDRVHGDYTKGSRFVVMLPAIDH
jgi:PAS domain S-box-containing protein